MSGLTRAGSYRSLVADRRVARVFIGAMTGRLGYAVLPLSLLFTIAHAADSFTVAATATAVLGVAGLTMPVQARLLDRLGPRRVLPVVGVLFAVVLACVAVFGAFGVASPAVWIPTCLVAGLVPPSLGPSMRAQWRVIAPDDLRQAAYSLDAVAEETVFLLGPLVSSCVLVVGPASLGVALAAVLTLVGVLSLACSPFVPVRRAPDPGHRAGSDRLGPFRSRGFRRLLPLMALAGVASAGPVTLVAAIANGAGRPAVAGLVEAGSGVAAVAGGLWWGRRTAEPRWPGDLAVLLAARIPLFVGCALLPHLWSIGLLVALTGALVAPTYVVGFTASDQETDPTQHTEASTWVTSVNNLGMSAGTAVFGALAARVGVSTEFWMIAAVVLAAALAARSVRR